MSGHLTDVNALRSSLDEDEARFKALASDLGWTESFLMASLDDIEGFFNHCNKLQAIEDTKRNVTVGYLYKFKQKSPDRRYIYVSRHKTKPVIPAHDFKKIDDSYVRIYWSQIFKYMDWTAKYSHFTLGKLVLTTTIDTLEQGRPMSMPLALGTANMSEHDRRALSIAIFSFIELDRYVDDKFLQVLVQDCSSSSVCHAYNLVEEFNQCYRKGLNVAPEEGHGFGYYLFIGHLMVKGKDFHWGLIHYSKNFFHALRYAFGFRSQAIRSEQHYKSYQSLQTLCGQRVGRYLAIIKGTDPEFHLFVILGKVFEYCVMLGDPWEFQAKILLKLYGRTQLFALKEAHDKLQKFKRNGALTTRSPKLLKICC